MATTTAPAPALSRLVPALPLVEAQAAAAAEMLVCIQPTYWARFKGSRTQLEAEGILPKETKWPEGATKARWEAGNLEFQLFRCRPEGLKGPMRLWTSGDYWTLEMRVKGRGWQWRHQQNIEEMAKALNEEIEYHTPHAQRARSLEWDRYWKAKCDKDFQSFKALIVPEPKKRGRPAKVRTEGASQGAQS